MTTTTSTPASSFRQSGPFASPRKAVKQAGSEPVSTCARSPSTQSGRSGGWLLAGVLVVAGAVGLWRGLAHQGAGGQLGDARAPAAEASTSDSGPASSAGRFRGGGGSGGAGGGFGANRAQPVSVQVVSRQDIRVMVSAIGTITASNTAVVRAQVSGVLQSLHFTEGQQVKAGQTLAQIDPRAFQASLSQAEGALARDQAQRDNARADLARYRDLLSKDAIAQQQVDTQAALLRQLDGTVKADQAAVDSARLQLTYTHVHAPISGRVGLKQVDLGNTVQPSDTNGVVSITQTRPIALVFSVPSSNLPQIMGRLRANQPLPVEAWDRSGTTRLAVGRVATVDNAIDSSTDSIKLKAVFANDDDALFPNQAVSVRLQLDKLADALVVPQAAVLRGAQGFYVYVVGADRNSGAKSGGGGPAASATVSTRPVKPGATDGDWTAVDSDLQVGDKVVIDGVDRLRDGAKVEVIAAEARQRAGAAPGGGRKHRRQEAGSPSSQAAS